MLHSLASHENPVSGGLVKGKYGAVAVEVEQCSNVGIDSKCHELRYDLSQEVLILHCSVLKKGGNAVDSAVASALCIGVIDSFATGLGG